MTTRDSKDAFYTETYSKGGETWTRTTSERRSWVANALSHQRLNHAACSVLDIGCGRGLNTIWLAERESQWNGLDVVSAEALKLMTPENGVFQQGNLRDPQWVANSTLMHRTYDVVVDQGSVLVSLDDPNERRGYIELLGSLVNPGGILVILVVYGDEPPMIFPDGRIRTCSTSDSLREEFPEFELVDTCANTYPEGDERNPLINREITVLHATLCRR